MLSHSEEAHDLHLSGINMTGLGRFVTTTGEAGSELLLRS
jgi:hypothetical protein